MTAETPLVTWRIYASFTHRLQESTALRYFTLLSEQFSRTVALTVGLMLGLSLTEGIGLLLLLPLLQLVGVSTGQQAAESVAPHISSLFAALRIPLTLVSVLVVYVLIMSAYALLSRWQRITGFEVSYQFESFLRQKLYQAVINTNWLFFSRNRASTFTHALTAEIERIGQGTRGLLQFFAGTLVLLVYLGVALILSPVATVVVAAWGLILLLGIRNKLSAARAKGEALSNTTRDLYGAVTEHLDGMKTVKSYGAQEQNAALFSRLNELITGTYIGYGRNWSDAQTLLDVGSVLILSFVLITLIDVLRVPAASALVLLFIFFRIVPRLSGIQQNYQGFTNMLPAFSNVTHLKDQCDDEAERSVGNADAILLRRSIALKDVSFSYQVEGMAAVDNATLTIKAGETTAIVGTSGAGKTTLADLIMGLIVPRAGAVLIDDAPLRAEWLNAWRSQIGYVAQDTFLFNGTIRANLLWAHPSATDEDLRTALRMAAAEDFIVKLPEGIETVLGDRGVRLSGGERQRLALARALLRKPTLLLLDEATSNLDSENERRIQDAIEALSGNITIIIITHRLSTIRHADAIYVLDQGRVVETGTWSDLVQNGGRFSALCLAQGVC